MKPKILIGSPVRQTPEILKEFLLSLEGLKSEGYSLEFHFIDDNDISTSSHLLETFAKQHPCTLIKAKQDHVHYLCNERTHHWNESLIHKVGGFKDLIIEEAKNRGSDYLFLIDSDTLVHPRTIHQLLLANKEIISNVLWTRWTPEGPLLPQFWVCDQYTLYKQQPGEVLSHEEKAQRTREFIEQFKEPGTYLVGGLGGCTLINKYALSLPISFKKIYNVSFLGEDRYFCIRAAALGLLLYGDTHLPAYHIYREADLAGVEEFKKKSNNTRVPESDCLDTL